MQRAASRLDVQRRKIGMKEGWQWALPKRTATDEETKNPNTKTVSPSDALVSFGSGVALRTAPYDGFAEGDSGPCLSPSEPEDPDRGGAREGGSGKDSGDDDSSMQDSV